MIDPNLRRTMNDWESLRGYVQSKYMVVEEDEHSLTLLFPTRGGRRQQVRIGATGGGWAAAQTAVCAEGELDVRAAMERNCLLRVGSLYLLGGFWVLEQKFHIEDVDARAVARVLQAIAMIGDDFELEYTGEDSF